MYDISTKKETRITSNGSAVGMNPAIYGDRIVWSDSRNGNEDIYMYDLSTKKETRITNHGSAGTIYGNRIVWPDSLNGVYNTHMYDISTHKETQIPSEGAVAPDIYGYRVVWDYEGVGPRYIYMYNISDSTKIRITTNDSEQEGPKIYGDRIVWIDWRNGMDNPSDICMATLSYFLTADFSASKTSGNAPLTVKFTDKSTNNPASWSWNFGDKTTSTSQNPVHKYTKAGKYTITLTVKNAAGSNTAKKTSYITVK